VKLRPGEYLAAAQLLIVDNGRVKGSALCLLFLLASLASCQLFDPPMAEVGMHITKGGDDISCLVQVFNEQGRQTQEVASSQMGVVYIKRLVPGLWTFKFVGHGGEVYPAVRRIQLGAGATSTIKVEVTVASDPEAEAAASSSVVTYGETEAPP